MSKFRNLALGLIVGLAGLSEAHAQKLDAGIQVTPSLPMGDFGDIADFGIGGMFFGEYYLNNNFHVGVEAGYLTYNSEIDLGPFGTQTITTNIVPLQVTSAYHTDAEGAFDLFFGTGVGLFMLGGDFQSSTEFGLIPRVGASLELTRELRATGNVGYMYITNSAGDLTALNINLGISYTLWD